MWKHIGAVILKSTPRTIWLWAQATKAFKSLCAAIGQSFSEQIVSNNFKSSTNTNRLTDVDQFEYNNLRLDDGGASRDVARSVPLSINYACNFIEKNTRQSSIHHPSIDRSRFIYARAYNCDKSVKISQSARTGFV